MTSAAADDAPHAANHDADPTDGRDETENEKLDRNWIEILQELRVTQTGTQILTGFLLTIAFQTRFATLTDGQRTTYLVLVSLAVLATALALAPVSLHRVLFGQREKSEIVRVADVLLRVTLVTVALVLAGTALLLFDVAVGTAAGVIAGVATLVIAALLWLALPSVAGRRGPSH